MEFFSGAVPVIWSMAGTAFLGLCGFAFKKLHGFNAEHTVNNAVAREHGPLKESVEAMSKKLHVVIKGLSMVLENDMVEEHRRLVHQRYATPSEKDRFNEMHKTFKALDEEENSNGAPAAMKADVMQMYSIAPKEEGK